MLTNIKKNTKNSKLITFLLEHNNKNGYVNKDNSPKNKSISLLNRNIL